MEMKTVRDGEKLTVYFKGRLDTNTAARADNELKAHTDGIKEIVIDLAELEYISSSGLRLLLKISQAFGGNVSLRNANSAVKEVFEVTGLAAAFDVF